MKADAPMVLDQTLSALLASQPDLSSPSGPDLASPTASPTAPERDLGQSSRPYLIAMADLSYHAGDRSAAEHFIRKLYALHDRHARKASAQAQVKHHRAHASSQKI